ncbi:MAG: TonB-dependent receptor plug domain-containing protein, partial [Vicinamibacterales bacterium]
MRTILLLLSCLVALPALAQTPGDVLDLTLEELLRQDTVSAASKFPQPTVDAPASITIVSADDIRRQGYQTLHEILQGINGLYVTSDRNYSYLGMRGFARPGDYNTRVLLLIDGHRINDPVYDMALLGGDFPLEVSLIERVEVIRGPASALYGTSAFLGVINVITRSGRELRGAQGEFGVGSLATQSGRTSFGAASGGRDLLVSAYGRRSDGARDLFFPEFATPDTHDGFVSNADQEGSAGAFVSASIGRISVRAVAHRRDKRVPTASWGSLFGDPSTTRDERSYIDLVYSGRFRGGWTGTARGSWDRMYYRGQYPYDYEDGLGRTLWSDEALSHEVGGELALTRTYTRNLVTIGGEFRRILTADQWGGQRGVLDVDDRREGRTWAVFAEDDLALIPRRLTLHAGMRLDHYESEGFEANPRVGLVYRPTPAASIKLLHGRAFRAPNYYERFYFEGMRAGLTVQPERIVTNEAIWEQRFGRRVRTSASV